MPAEGVRPPENDAGHRYIRLRLLRLERYTDQVRLHGLPCTHAAVAAADLTDVADLLLQAGNHAKCCPGSRKELIPTDEYCSTVTSTSAAYTASAWGSTGYIGSMLLQQAHTPQHDRTATRHCKEDPLRLPRGRRSAARATRQHMSSSSGIHERQQLGPVRGAALALLVTAVQPVRQTSVGAITHSTFHGRC